MKDHIFFVYEEEHLKEALELSRKGTKIICLHILLERACRDKNIPFLPLRNFVDSETDEESWWIFSHEISREWYRLKEMDFFKYRGMRLAEAPEPIMQAHLAKLFYYVRIFIFIKKAFPQATFSIPKPLETKIAMFDCLLALQPWAVLCAGQMTKIVDFQVEDCLPSKKYLFPQATRKTKILAWYNWLIGLLPKHNFKIYLSGYWPHAESLLPLLKKTDVILLETKRFLQIPWWQLLSHRLKAKYSHGPVGLEEERKVRSIGEDFLKKWQKAKGEVARYLSTLRPELDWRPVLEACEHIILYSPRILADIDTLFEVMEKEKPNLVLQMASVGGPHHYFFLMAKIAAQLNIPSVELQHATVTIDPRSVFCRIETDYLLTYGPAIDRWHTKIGNEPKKLIPVGSPRFDQYIHKYGEGVKKGQEIFARLGLDPEKQVLLVAVPFSETYASAIDSYQLVEFFEVISEFSQKNPQVQILFKCRIPKSVEQTKEYLKGLAFSHFVVTGDEDIFPLMCASDATICNNTTVIYQAILAKKPLILYPWKRFDYYHAEIYNHEIPLVHTAREALEILQKIFNDRAYHTELLKKQERFLANYAFDGKSSARVAEILPKLAQRKV